MARFNRLQKLEQSQTARYEMFQVNLGLEELPVLEVKPANESNKPYWNALFKKMATRRMRQSALDAKMASTVRSHDKYLYPKHVIIGWENVVDDERNVVEFSQKDCEDFLNALPDWILDDLRGFCSDPTNFVSDQEDAVEAQEVGKH